MSLRSLIDQPTPDSAALGRSKSTKALVALRWESASSRGPAFQVATTGFRKLTSGLPGQPELSWLSLCICVRVWRRSLTCADVMALRKSPVPVSDVSSHLDCLFLFQHCPHSTTQRFNKPHRIAVSCLATCHDLLLGCQSPLACCLCVTASGSAYPDVTNQHNNQLPGSHASWHATIRFASPCLSPHAAPLITILFNSRQQSARTTPNLKCLFLTVAAVSTRRRSSAHQGDDEPRDGT